MTQEEIKKKKSFWHAQNVHSRTPLSRGPKARVAVCCACNIEKPRSEFYEITPTEKGGRRNGLHSSCKPCAREIQNSRPRDAEWHKKNREQSLRDYYNHRKERILKSKRPSIKYSSYKSDAKRRGIEFSLTMEEFMLFWNRLCFYCGDRVETVGLDRMNNSKGYYLGNLASCCATCNLMKRGSSALDFMKQCEKIASKSRHMIDESLINLTKRYEI